MSRGCDTVSMTFHSESNRKCRQATAVLLFCLAAASCSRGSNVVPVSGIVTFEGEPLVNGFVMFNVVAQDQGRPCRGRIGPGGRFTLSTFQPNDGVMPADYTITVRSWVPGSGPTPYDERAGVMVTSSIPERYMDSTTSGLKQTVGDSALDITVELTEEE